MVRKLFIGLFLLFLLTPIYLFSQILESQPLVSQTRAPDAEDARKAKALLKRTLLVLETHQSSRLTASEAELNAVIAFLDRGSSRLSGQFRLSDSGLDGIFTLSLPELQPLDQHINLFITLLPSGTGFDLGPLQLGKLKIPGSLALSLLQNLADLFIGGQFGRRILGTIEQVGFADRQVSLGVSSGAELVALKEQLRVRLQEFRQDYDQVGNREKIVFYHQQLLQMGQLNLGDEKLSLNRYLAPLFQLAAIRSEKSSPSDENQAALYALAIYLGSEKIEQFTGELYAPEQALPSTRTANVVLAGRRDLRQHFLVSAALKLLTDAELGFVAGEFKELLDSNQGGSGFSFIDLAADRAGLAFAEQATGTIASARKVQRIISQSSDESSFFPDFSDLEEGLDIQRFVQRYRDIDSREYAQIVQQIDQRLARLAIYQ